MSPFLIFAISLTIAYAIYYAVMITRDLYGKKEEAKSNEEVFDISNITEEEAAVAVNESDGGFSVADKQYDTSFQDGTSYDEGYGMGTENNGMSDYSQKRILPAEKMMLMKTKGMMSTNRSRRTQPSRCRKRWMGRWSPLLPYG